MSGILTTTPLNLPLETSISTSSMSKLVYKQYMMMPMKIPTTKYERRKAGN